MPVISVVGSNAQRSQDVAQSYDVDGRLWQTDEGTQKQRGVGQHTGPKQLCGSDRGWLFSTTSQSNPKCATGAAANWVEEEPDEDHLLRLFLLSQWRILMMFLCQVQH